MMLKLNLVSFRNFFMIIKNKENRNITKICANKTTNLTKFYFY